MTEARKLDQSLRLARDAFSPSSAQQQRVQAALAGRLAAAGTGPASVPSVSAQSPGAAARALALTKGSIILGVGFALGYWTAERRDRALAVADRDGPTLSAPEANASSSAVRAPLPSSSTGHPQATSETPATASAGNAAAEPPAPRKPSPRSGTNRATARKPSPDTSVRSAAAADEIALLQRAERAIRAGDGALARALIADLDSKFEQTTLREERAAVLILAACTLGEAGAESGAREFLESHSSSVYFDRIQTLCNLGGSRSAAPAEADESRARGH